MIDDMSYREVELSDEKVNFINKMISEINFDELNTFEDSSYIDLSDNIIHYAERLGENAISPDYKEDIFYNYLALHAFESFLTNEAERTHKHFWFEYNLPYSKETETFARRELFSLNYININENYIHVLNVSKPESDFGFISKKIHQSHLAPDIYFFVHVDVEEQFVRLLGFVKHSDVDQISLTTNIDEDVYLIPLDETKYLSELVGLIKDPKERQEFNINQYEEEVKDYFALSEENIMENFDSITKYLPENIYLGIASSDEFAEKYLRMQRLVRTGEKELPVIKPVSPINDLSFSLELVNTESTSIEQSVETKSKIINIDDFRQRALALCKFYIEKEHNLIERKQQFAGTGDKKRVVILEQKQDKFEVINHNLVYEIFEVLSTSKIQFQIRGLDKYKGKNWILFVCLDRNELDKSEAPESIFNSLLEGNDRDKFYVMSSLDNKYNVSNDGLISIKQKYEGKISFLKDVVVYLFILE